MVLSRAYSARSPDAQPQANKIAVVMAKGTILDGEQPEGTIGGDTLTGILNGLDIDNDIKAVVLRVDSPGGSAFASELIRDAIQKITEKKIPVVVSMGSYAATEAIGLLLKQTQY